MEYMATIFSILFFMGALVSLSMGVYIFRLNPKFWTNRVYFLVSLSLAIWSFSFAIANCSNDIAYVLLWRRISALGWSTVFSFTLHFLLLMSNNDKGIKSSKWLALLYIPSVVLIYAYSLSSRLAIINYNIVKIDYGDRITEFHDVRYHLCKALEEILHEMEYESGIRSREVIRGVNEPDDYE